MTRNARLAALIVLAGLASAGAARAQSAGEGDGGTIRRGEGAVPERIDTLRDVFLTLQSCWRRPRGEGLSGEEVTIRLSFRRDGAVLGEPKITFYRPGTTSSQGRQAFIASVKDTFARCTPLRFTPSFGAAVAGRPFTFRFVDSQAL